MFSRTSQRFHNIPTYLSIKCNDLKIIWLPTPLKKKPGKYASLCDRLACQSWLWYVYEVFYLRKYWFIRNRVRNFLFPLKCSWNINKYHDFSTYFGNCFLLVGASLAQQDLAQNKEELEILSCTELDEKLTFSQFVK